MGIVGHKETILQIEVAIESAKKRNTAPPHMLFTGHAGCGKTSMAKEVSQMLGTDFISVIPEDIKNKKSVFDLLESLNYEGYDERGNRIAPVKPAVVFFDECHRLPQYAQEKLGIAMENFMMESGQANKFYWVPYFTMIGATTLQGELTKPFLDRFKLTFFFEPYNNTDSCKIIKYHAKRMGLPITNKAVRDLAVRGRGVPRVMLRYLERCRDTLFSKGGEFINSRTTNETFAAMEIDELGFNKIELKILKSLYNAEKPIGLETLSLITGESKKTIQNEIETYLVRQEYMHRSGAGRLITPKGRNYLEDKGYVGKKAGRVAIAADYVRS